MRHEGAPVAAVEIHGRNRRGMPHRAHVQPGTQPQHLDSRPMFALRQRIDRGGDRTVRPPLAVPPIGRIVEPVLERQPCTFDEIDNCGTV